MARRLSYDDWQDALAQEFLDGRHVGHGFWLFVDDDVADAVGASVGVQDGAAQLADLGRSYVSSESGMGIFAGGPWDRHQRWLGDGAQDVPPNLPVLALSVLAASRMQADDEVSQTNYYRRFRQLVGLRSSGGMPNGFDRTVVVFWRGLRDWARDREDRIGRLLIPEDPSPAFVGYPISQALWRRTDTDHLATALWEEVGDDLAGMAVDEIAPLARHLALRAEVVPARARRVFAEDRFVEVRDRILEDIVSTPPPPQTTAAERVRTTRRTVLLHGRAGPRLSLRFAVARDERWPATLRAKADTGENVVARTPPTVPGYYALDGVTPTAQVLREGFVLDTEYGQWRFEPQELYVLAPHSELGLATTQLDRVDEAIVLAPADHVRRTGWPRPVTDESLPPGWVRYDGVRPDQTGDDDLQVRLQEAVGGSLDLDGGLAIRPRTYLAFAPPDIVLPPALANQPAVEVEVDGDRWQLRPWGGHVRLRDLGLAEGRHTIRVGDGVIALTITEGIAPTCSFDAGHAAPLTHGRILGAYLDPLPPAPRPRPVVVSSRADEVVLLGARVGEVATPDHDAPPQWLARTPVQTTDHEVRPGFDVVWVIERWPNHTDRRLIADAPPIDALAADPDATARWVDAVAAYLAEVPDGDAHRELAESYVRVAAARSPDGEERR